MKISRTFRSVLILVTVTISITGNILAQPLPRSGMIMGWKDDNSYLVRERGEDGSMQVMSVDVKTGKKKLCEDYASTRDMFNKQLPEGFSIGYGMMVNDGQKTVVLSKDNDLWSFTLGEEEAKQLTFSDAVEHNPALSPAGDKVAFTREHDLYVIDLLSGEEERLTFDGARRVYNGYASWVYYEEILGRASRYSAFWWSPDSKKIAYLHTDDNPVPDFTITRVDKQDGLHGTQEVTAYPKPGDPNPVVKMGIVNIDNATTTWVKTDESVDQYLAWPAWRPGSNDLLVQVLNRDQDDIRFILADCQSGDFKEIYRETRDTWVDFFEDNYIMKDGSGFIIRSSKSDWCNLYYYDWDGKLISQLTDFDWRVTSILRVDEKRETVYFSGTGTESTDNHIFSVALDGSNFVKYSKQPGTHMASISPGGKYVIDTWSNINTPRTVIAVDRKGRIVRTIAEPAISADDAGKLPVRELVKIPSTDGFVLPAIITYPLNFDPAKKYPVVFTIYGGPDAGGVRNTYSDRTDWYAQNNIITINVDHRASGKFGKKGLDYMHRNLGKWEMVDYGEAAKWLIKKNWADPSRMGITGGSYGGYTTALALTAGSDIWTHGIASSSVTDWRLYDNVYTERYMDTPQDNAEGYENGSVLNYTDRLKGKLYIVHGTADDNVHMQNSIYLISKLQDEGKDFLMMIYPGGRHGWGGAKRNHSTEAAHKLWLKWFFGE